MFFIVGRIIDGGFVTGWTREVFTDRGRAIVQRDEARRFYADVDDGGPEVQVFALQVEGA